MIKETYREHGYTRYKQDLGQVKVTWWKESYNLKIIFFLKSHVIERFDYSSHYMDVI